MATIGNLVVNIISRAESMEKGSIVSRVAIAGVNTAAIAGGIAMLKYATGIKSTIGLLTAGAAAAGRLVSSLVGTVGGWSTVTTWAIRLGSAIVTTRLGMLGMVAAAGVLATAILGVGTAFGSAAVRSAADFEQLEVSFSTMLRSGENAKALLSDISEFAATTPFEFKELSSASRSLIAFGVSQQQLIPSLRAIGDVAAGVSQPIGEIAEIYGKARVQGRLFAEDINQFTGRGIPIIQELAAQFGVADTEVKQLVKDGKVGFSDLEKAFQSMTAEGGRFHNMMEAQSQTFNGLSSTLMDNLGIALRDVGKAMTEAFDLKDVMKSLISATDGVRNLASATAEHVAILKTLGSAGTGVTAGKSLGALGQLATAGVNTAGYGRLQAFATGLTGADETIKSNEAKDRQIDSKLEALWGTDAEWKRRGMILNEAMFKPLFLNSLFPGARQTPASSKSFAQNKELAREMFLGMLPEVNKEAARMSGKSRLQNTELVKGMFLDMLGPLPDEAKKKKDKKGRQDGPTFASAAEKGSREEFNQFVKSITGPKLQERQLKAEEDQVALGRDQLREMRDIARSVRDSGTQVVEIA
jgi:tape measure domain-containing protein